MRKILLFLFLITPFAQAIDYPSGSSCEYVAQYNCTLPGLGIGCHSGYICSGGNPTNDDCASTWGGTYSLPSAGGNYFGCSIESEGVTFCGSDGECYGDWTATSSDNLTDSSDPSLTSVPIDDHPDYLSPTDDTSSCSTGSVSYDGNNYCYVGTSDSDLNVIDSTGTDSTVEDFFNNQVTVIPDTSDDGGDTSGGGGDTSSGSDTSGSGGDTSGSGGDTTGDDVSEIGSILDDYVNGDSGADSGGDDGTGTGVDTGTGDGTGTGDESGECDSSVSDCGSSGNLFDGFGSYGYSGEIRQFDPNGTGQQLIDEAKLKYQEKLADIKSEISSQFATVSAGGSCPTFHVFNVSLNVCEKIDNWADIGRSAVLLACGMIAFGILFRANS